MNNSVMIPQIMIDHINELLYGWIIYHPIKNKIKETNSYFGALFLCDEGYEIIGKI